MFINQIVSLLSVCSRIQVYVCICVNVLVILDVIVHIIYVWIWKITGRYGYNNVDTYEYNMCKYPHLSGTLRNTSFRICVVPVVVFFFSCVFDGN